MKPKLTVNVDLQQKYFRIRNVSIAMLTAIDVIVVVVEESLSK